MARPVVDAVPNEGIREAVIRAVERGDITWERLAKELGIMRRWRKHVRWTNADGSGRNYRSDRYMLRGDGSTLKRLLGARTYRSKGGVYRQRYIREDVAVQIVHLLGLDPVDVGI